MKYIGKYLLAILPCLFLLIGCDEDVPTYRQLDVDASEVKFHYGIDEKIAGQKEVNITDGNGNYILKQLSNELTSLEAFDKITEIEADGGNADTIIVAVAKLEENKLVITPKYTGTITYQLQDWAKSTQIITIIVEQDKPDEELTTRSSVFSLRVGEEASTEIYSGNGGYKVESLDPEIVTVRLDGLNIIATAVGIGDTRIKITDEKEKEAFIEISVDEAIIPFTLVDAPEERIWLTTGGVDNAVLYYQGGNGNVRAKSIPSSLNVAIDEEAQTITVSGKTTRTMVTLTIIDKYDQEIPIDFAIDYPFLENTTSRILRNGAFATFSNSRRTAEYVSAINLTYIQTWSTSIIGGGGIGISFKGNMNVGVKTDARIYNVTTSGSESAGTSISLSSCEIVKIEDGVYWITFTQKETGQTGYIVIYT